MFVAGAPESGDQKVGVERNFLYIRVLKSISFVDEVNGVNSFLYIMRL